jgi:spermidine synthase
VFLGQDRPTGIPVRGLTFVLLALLSLPLAARLYSRFFERLIFGVRPEANDPFAHIVENRDAVIAVTQDGAVFNGGVYDGYFNIDPTNDINTVVRAYALSAFHPDPKRIFLLGLSTGSWAQILANHPELEWMDVVEINPGTLQLIPEYPMVRSLLSNPKVHIHIDDARRWLLAHPREHYDAIIANGSFYWRDHSSYILSTEFLRLVRAHLNPGGVFYYNSTESKDVLATGLSVYPYALRVINFLAVSDSPIQVDANRWMNILRQYRIDGVLVFNPSNAAEVRALEAYAALADTINYPPRFMGMESNARLRARLTGRFIFTDDNMGWDWRNGFEIPWRTPVTQSALAR